MFSRVSSEISKNKLTRRRSNHQWKEKPSKYNMTMKTWKMTTNSRACPSWWMRHRSSMSRRMIKRNQIGKSMWCTRSGFRTFIRMPLSVKINLRRRERRWRMMSALLGRSCLRTGGRLISRLDRLIVCYRYRQLTTKLPWRRVSNLKTITHPSNCNSTKQQTIRQMIKRVQYLSEGQMKWKRIKWLVVGITLADNQLALQRMFGSACRIESMSTIIIKPSYLIHTSTIWLVKKIRRQASHSFIRKS